MPKKYELIIFDLDGTFYDNEDLVKTNYDMAVDYLVKFNGFSYKEAIDLFSENDIYPYLTGELKSTTQLFKKMNLDIDLWDRYRSEVFSAEPIIIEHAASRYQLQQITSKCKAVLLTNNTLSNIEKVLNRISIAKQDFAFIYYAKHQQGRSSKKDTMQEIIREYGVDPANVLAIGDRLKIDGQPLLDLGGDAIILKRPNIAFDRIIADYPDFKSCDEYKFYTLNS